MPQQPQTMPPVEKTGFKPQYNTVKRDNIPPGDVFPGMWIYNTDTREPERWDGDRWVPLSSVR